MPRAMLGAMHDRGGHESCHEKHKNTHFIQKGTTILQAGGHEKVRFERLALEHNLSGVRLDRALSPKSSTFACFGRARLRRSSITNHSRLIPPCSSCLMHPTPLFSSSHTLPNNPILALRRLASSHSLSISLPPCLSLGRLIYNSTSVPWNPFPNRLSSHHPSCASLKFSLPSCQAILSRCLSHHNNILLAKLASFFVLPNLVQGHSRDSTNECTAFALVAGSGEVSYCCASYHLVFLCF